MRHIAHSTAWKNTVVGARPNFLPGWVMAAFEYRQAQELRDAFARRGVQYLFLGKSGAILLGFPDTTQDVDLFPQRSRENGQAMLEALHDMRFTLTETQTDEILRGKDFVQLKH